MSKDKSGLTNIAAIYETFPRLTIAAMMAALAFGVLWGLCQALRDRFAKADPQEEVTQPSE